MPNIKSVIFDLDGTLIDSSASILASYQVAFEATGFLPVQPLNSLIIGPPLRPTLQKLSGSSDSDLLDALTTAFIAHYDSTGYRHTKEIDGSDAFLRELATEKMTLFIATNKRIVPTRMIVEHLGWSSLFHGVYALDSWGAGLRAKDHVIRRIIELHALQPDFTLYVGDRDEDLLAAQLAEVPFFQVPWGYGTHPPRPSTMSKSTVGWEELRHLLLVE